MAMSQSVLASQLLNLGPASTEAFAISNLVDLYGEFASDAQAATPILPAGVALGKAAMAGALIGMSAPGQAATKIEAGIQAFWGAVAGGLASSFAGATLITAPPHTGLAGALQPVFDSNTAGQLNEVNSANAVAVVLYAAAIIGGSVTVSPTTTPIT